MKDFLTANSVVFIFLAILWLQNFKWKGFAYYMSLIIVYVNPKNWFKLKYRYFLVNVQIYAKKYHDPKSKLKANGEQLRYIKDFMFTYETTGEYPNRVHLLKSAKEKLDKDGTKGYIVKPSNIIKLTSVQYLEWIANPKVLAELNKKKKQ